MIHDGQTIIACSSGGQAAAIAVIRLSGPFILPHFQEAFSFPLSKVKDRKMNLGKIVGPVGELDEACFCFFEGPNSFTGENVLELFVHGNPLNVSRIIDRFLEFSFVRLAKPGEFSLRALQAKKISLAQVEGLDLFLNAISPLALEQGLSLMHGELSREYLALLEGFKKHKAALELLLDFHEDVGEEQARKIFHDTWSAFYFRLTTLAKRVGPNSSSLLRPEVVIAGLPNAGKSTFFNWALSEERALVSSIKGTTRDFLSEDIKFGDVTYRLIDTAGVRDTTDGLEAAGIERTWRRLELAFFSVLLINPFETDSPQLKELLKHKFDLIFFTHADHPGSAEARAILESMFPVLSGQPEIGIPQLGPVELGEFGQKLNNKYVEALEGKPLLVDRHKRLILDAFKQSKYYSSINAIEQDLAIISHELNELGHCLQELLGIVSADDLLDDIFANFCIGK